MEARVVLQRPGTDTELARLLHRTERVDLATLRAHLEEARRARPGAGPTLAQVLVQRGLVTPAEVASLLGQLGRQEGGGWAATLPPGVASGTGTEVGRWAASSVEQSRALGRPSGRYPARPSGSWEVRPAEATEVGRNTDPDRGPDRGVEAWRPGGRVGEYVLERAAGAGAMGVVFVGRHVHTGGRHAIKTLRNGEDPTLVERFRREGEAQARVDGHPNVARVHSMGEAHGRLYLVMELVEGGNLEERLKRGTPPWPEAARIVAGVARGLAHMHSRGVHHRDLKPSNVLFDQDGVPKLVDFGLARPVGADRLTLTGEVVGTPAYMAPEQALGHRDQLGPWTDAWALGGVLFYVLTGRPPFDGVTSLQVITRVAEEEAPAPRSVRADVPAELDALCRSLMRREPAMRLTAEKAAERLEAFAAAAERAEGATDDAAPGSRSRVVVGLAGLAVASVAAAVVALAVGGARPAASTTAPEPAPVSRTSEPTTDAATGAGTEATTEATTEPPPATPASTEPWAAGQSRACVVRAQIEGEYPIWAGRIRLGVTQRLDMRWDVVAVEDARVRIDATIEALALTGRHQPVGGGVPAGDAAVDFDSRRDANGTSPLLAAVGARLQLELDAVTGQVLELRGAEEAQDAVFARARADDPDAAAEEGAADEDQGQGSDRRFGGGLEHRVPLLADPQGLREALNGVLHVFQAPSSPSASPSRARKWKLTRAPEVAGPYWPGGLSAEVEVLAADEAPTLSWTGSRRATYRPAFAPDMQGTIERMIHGGATLTPSRARVVSGSFKETWRSEIVDRRGLEMKGVYEFEVTLSDR